MVKWIESKERKKQPGSDEIVVFGSKMRRWQVTAGKGVVGENRVIALGRKRRLMLDPDGREKIKRIHEKWEV
jgi:hypothetical protein